MQTYLYTQIVTLVLSCKDLFSHEPAIVTCFVVWAEMLTCYLTFKHPAYFLHHIIQAKLVYACTNSDYK